MILLFNKIPVTRERKVNEAVALAKSLYGSEFYNYQGQYWFGDNLTTNSLFPNWILQEAESDSSNVLIVQIIKSYLRWLFSEKYGYGGKVDWENIQCPFTINDKFLQALANKYFPNEDFSSSSDLYDILPNIKKFAIQSDVNFFNIKGTAESIKYAICTLLGVAVDACEVQTGSPGFLIVIADIPEKYKPFLNRAVYPAGIIVTYQSP
jgi:hypothetical protein